MTDKDYTHLTLVVDRSGSMQDMAAEAEAGVNRLLQEQFAEEEGYFTYTLVQFDDKIECVARLSHEPTTYRLVPRGATALLDAVGGEIAATGIDLAALREIDRPSKVVFLIVTDGYENCSREWSGDRVKKMVDHQRDKYGWQFQFLGAGESALQGKGLGMGSTQYAATAHGTRSVYDTSSSVLSSYRSGALKSYDMPE